MLESVSPYALLRASIPKAVTRIANAYDLFSVAQSAAQDVPAQEAAPARRGAAEPASAPEPQAVPVPQAVPEPPVIPEPRVRASTLPARRTHYISDIAARHNAAARSASFLDAPAARRNPPLQPPVQRPET